MALSPIELISVHPWRRTVFTTYTLSLSFFEAVVLDALVRGGGQERLVLADIEGVRASLSELGACRVGKEYELEPVAVASGVGVFHPKISVLCGDGDCHILVGSGNLTFGGWGDNFEVLEHLHPSFAADAVLDAADFFDQLSSAGHIRHGAAAPCWSIAEELRAAARTHPRNGDLRLYHSLSEAISVQLAGAVDELGGATRLAIASPFWDGGAAVDRLCEAVGLDHVYVHAHAGETVKGNAGSNWPVNRRPSFGRRLPLNRGQSSTPDDKHDGEIDATASGHARSALTKCLALGRPDLNTLREIAPFGLRVRESSLSFLERLSAWGAHPGGQERAEWAEHMSRYSREFWCLLTY